MYEFETVLVIIDVGNLNQPSTVIFEKTRLHKNELKRPNKHQSSNAILLRLPFSVLFEFVWGNDQTKIKYEKSSSR